VARRNARQVVANGGVAAGRARRQLAGIRRRGGGRDADTWATEIGAFSKTAPRLITSGVRSPGRQRGITPLEQGGGGACSVAAVIAWPERGCWRPTLVGSAWWCGSVWPACLSTRCLGPPCRDRLEMGSLGNDDVNLATRSPGHHRRRRLAALLLA